MRKFLWLFFFVMSCTIEGRSEFNAGVAAWEREEYDRAISEFGDRRLAEGELDRRRRRIHQLEIRPLGEADRDKFAEQWRTCQAQFVDDPAGAVGVADHVLTDIIRARGYSAENAYDRMADLSAAYPHEIASYRLANEIVVRHSRGEATTEDLRKALVHYRKVFEQILGDRNDELKRVS